MKQINWTAGRVALFVCVIGLVCAPASAQDYIGIDTCQFCHGSEVTFVLNSFHPDKVLASSEVLTTDGTGDSAGSCAPGTTIFDPCTAGYDTFIAPYDTFFHIDNVEYALGKHWKQRFMTQTVPVDGDAGNSDPANVTQLPADKYVVMGAQWNMAMQHWQDYHGPTGENNWYTEGRYWNTKCGSCHTTGFNPITDEWIEQDRGAQQGVTCEACHGPASLHANSPFSVKPAFPQNFAGGSEGPAQSEAEADRRLEICGQCHGRGASAPNGSYGFPFEDDLNENYVSGMVLADYYTQTTSASSFWPDGSSKKHHQQYIDFLKSTHWTGPDFADKLYCTSCHMAHKAEMVDGGGSGLCQQCHTDKVGAGFTAHTGGGFMTEGVMDCNDCHMPFMATTINPYDIRAHTFKIVPPANSIEPTYGGQPNSCTYSCHTADTPGFPMNETTAQSALYSIRFANGGSKTELGGLIVDKNATDLMIFWDASTDDNHAAYRLYRTVDASSALTLDESGFGGFGDAANWVNIAGEDLDGDSTNTSFTRLLGDDPLEFFLVVDEGNYIGDGPWGHYSR